MLTFHQWICPINLVLFFFKTRPAWFSLFFKKSIWCHNGVWKVLNPKLDHPKTFGYPLRFKKRLYLMLCVRGNTEQIAKDSSWGWNSALGSLKWPFLRENYCFENKLKAQIQECCVSLQDNSVLCRNPVLQLVMPTGYKKFSLFMPMSLLSSELSCDGVHTAMGCERCVLFVFIGFIPTIFLIMWNTRL